MTTLAYHSDPKFKADFVQECIWHREQDRYISGTFQREDKEGFKGCSIGCSVNSLKRLGKNSIDYSDHAGCAKLLGWPEWLCRLQDGIFEGLPAKDRPRFTEQLAQAIPVGADMTMIWPKFAHWLLVDPKDGVIRLAETDQVRDAINTVGSLFQRWIDGDKPSVGEWESAESAARATSAESAEWSAERSAARSAARAAWSAQSAASAQSAESAARSAARSAESAASAQSAERQKQRDKLFELLKAAPVLKGVKP